MAPSGDSADSSSQRGALLPRSFRKQLPTAVRGQGVFVFDQSGRSYIDFSGGAAVTFIGHGDKRITQAIAAQLNELEYVHSSQFTTPVAEALAEEVLDFAGPSFRGGAVYLCSGGSEAVESALKLARQYFVEIGQTERTRFISRGQGYHGATLGAVGVSGNRLRREIYLPLVKDAEHVTAPYCYRCVYDCPRCGAAYAEEIDDAAERLGGAAAAFIFEPMSGATLGGSIPPGGYLARVREICDQRGMLMIADEVMTGCGRTGRNFALEHWNVVPDIIVSAKALASGYAPLGAVIVSPKIVDAVASGSGTVKHGLTFSAHPVSAAAGLAVLRKIRAAGLVQQADSSLPGSAGYHLREQLQSLSRLPSVGDLRGLGLLWGVELVADQQSKQPFEPQLKAADRVAAEAAERGVMVYPMQGCVDGVRGDHLLIAPPAIITREQIESAVESLRAAIEQVTEALPKPRTGGTASRK